MATNPPVKVWARKRTEHKKELGSFFTIVNRETFGKEGSSGPKDRRKEVIIGQRGPLSC